MLQRLTTLIYDLECVGGDSNDRQIGTRGTTGKNQKANEERRIARQKQIGQKRDAKATKVNKERKNNSRKWIKNVEGYIQTISQRAIDEHISDQKLE